MQIFSEKLDFRLKRSEYGQFQAIMKKEKLNRSNAGRLLFHLGIKAYLEANKLPVQ